MTYFSDFDYSDQYLNDETIRKNILREAEDMYIETSYETVPEDLFEDPIEELY